MNTRDSEPAEKTWKRVAALTLWLLLAAPVGIWKLWQDPVLSTRAKWRIFVYLFLLPVLVYIVFSLWTTNRSLARLMP